MNTTSGPTTPPEPSVGSALPPEAWAAIRERLMWAEAEASVRISHDPRCQTYSLEDLPPSKEQS